MKQKEIRKIALCLFTCFFMSAAYAEDSENTQNPETQTENSRENQAPPQKKSPDQETKESDSKEENLLQNKALYKTVSKNKDTADTPQTDKSQNKADTSQKQNQKPKTEPSTQSLEEKAQKVIQNLPSQPIVLPHQTMPQSAPEQPIPYYNPVNREEEAVSVLPSSQPKELQRKHRLSLYGNAIPWVSSSQRIKNTFKFNVSADYGYVFNVFEVGPFASVSNLKENDIRDSFIRDINFDIGLFAGLHLNKNSLDKKYAPVLELKIGYRRTENRGGLLAQLGAGVQYFVSPQAAVYLTAAPFYVHKFSGGGKYGNFGVEIPFGLRFYFLR